MTIFIPSSKNYLKECDFFDKFRLQFQERIFIESKKTLLKL
jgi:hypothetical protein